jgi:Trk-type K+ transport system membrane component
MGVLILAGNTAYPVFLRLIVWSLRKLLTLLTKDDEYTGLKDTFKFILRYPRRVYTNLFAARPMVAGLHAHPPQLHRLGRF